MWKSHRKYLPLQWIHIKSVLQPELLLQPLNCADRNIAQLVFFLTLVPLINSTLDLPAKGKKSKQTTLGIKQKSYLWGELETICAYVT